MWEVRRGERQRRSRIFKKGPGVVEQKSRKARCETTKPESSDDDAAFGEPLMRFSSLRVSYPEPLVDLGGCDSVGDIKMDSPSFNND